MIQDMGRVTVTLKDLRALGIGLSIDDFGTGYSSLSHVHRLPLTELKIDRSFISAQGRAPTDLSLARTIIAMGKEMGLVVVAEGVEDAVTAETLRTLECDIFQGYHFSPPLAPDGLHAFLRDRTRNLVQASSGRE